MKNTVHCRGLMNCIFRVTLAFLMKVDEFPWAGQLRLNWCWLCQDTSMLKPKRKYKYFRLINLPLVCQIFLVKTYDSKCDIYHNQSQGPSSCFSSLLFSSPEMNMFSVGGINPENSLTFSLAELSVKLQNPTVRCRNNYHDLYNDLI